MDVINPAVLNLIISTFLLLLYAYLAVQKPPKAFFRSYNSLVHDSFTRLLTRQPPDRRLYGEGKRLFTPEIGLLILIMSSINLIPRILVLFTGNEEVNIIKL